MNYLGTGVPDCLINLILQFICLNKDPDKICVLQWIDIFFRFLLTSDAPLSCLVIYMLHFANLHPCWCLLPCSSLYSLLDTDEIQV